jgi:hypothetical protein
LNTDFNEFVEIEHPWNVPLSGYQLVFCDGLTGRMYTTIPINIVATPPSTGSNGKLYIVVYASPVTGIEDGLKDGIALYNNNTNEVIEFISYEGSFIARNGVANNIVAVDVNVYEDGNGGVDGSIQKCIDNTSRWIVNDNTNTRSSPNSRCPSAPALGQVRQQFFDDMINTLLDCLNLHHYFSSLLIGAS